jgi:hypothetical protein
MDLEKYFNIQDLAGQQIPKEIVDQIKVLGRVQFPLKPTSTIGSAISSSSEQTSSDELNSEVQLSGLIDHVSEMEALADQLEDMIDQLTKNMNIPVNASISPDLSNAVKTLGGDGTSITKDIFDKALAIMDYSPIMLTGQDPILAAMTGNGKIDGPYMNCDEITRGVAKIWNTADPKDYNPEGVLPDSSTAIKEDFEKHKKNMGIEIVLMAWWNLLWPKFIVSLVIINPLRTMYAYPMDTIITFFKNLKKQCGKGRFRRKSKECMKNYGPINLALNKLACFLICTLPPLLYKRYRPSVLPADFKIKKNGKLVPCNCSKISKCPPEDQAEIPFNEKGGLDQLSNLMENLGEPCGSSEEFSEGPTNEQPTGLGLPPNCVGAAQTILSAVVADALTPKDSSSFSTPSSSATSIREEQANTLGG